MAGRGHKCVSIERASRWGCRWTRSASATGTEVWGHAAAPVAPLKPRNTSRRPRGRVSRERPHTSLFLSLSLPLSLSVSLSRRRHLFFFSSLPNIILVASFTRNVRAWTWCRVVKKKKRKSYKHAECSSNPSWTPEVVVSRTMFVKRSFKPRRSKKDRSDEGRADDPDLVLFVRRWDLDLIIIKEKEKRFAGYTRAKTTALSRNGVHRIINTRLPSAVAIPLLSFVVLLVRRNPMCVCVPSREEIEKCLLFSGETR